MARWALIYLLGYLPLTFLLIYAGLGLVGVRPGFRRLLLPAASVGLAAAALRPYLPQGWYPAAYMVLFSVGLVGFRLSSILQAVAASAIGFILIAAGDLLVVAPTVYLLEITFEEITRGGWPYIVLGNAAEGSIVLLAACLVRWRSLTLLSIPRREEAQTQRGAGK